MNPEIEEQLKLKLWMIVISVLFFAEGILAFNAPLVLGTLGFGMAITTGITCLLIGVIVIGFLPLTLPNLVNSN